MISDWIDVILHVVIGAAASALLAWFIPWWAAAGANFLFWFVREAVQAKHAAWRLWSEQKKAEAFAPAIAGLAAALLVEAVA